MKLKCDIQYEKTMLNCAQIIVDRELNRNYYKIKTIFLFALICLAVTQNSI